MQTKRAPKINPTTLYAIFDDSAVHCLGKFFGSELNSKIDEFHDEGFSCLLVWEASEPEYSDIEPMEFWAY